MLEMQIQAAQDNGDAYLKSLEFTGDTLSHTDLTKFEFQSVSFTSCQFSNCDFTKAGFYNCVFARCSFLDCKFTDCYMRETQLHSCKCDGANYSYSHFKQSHFTDSTFLYANFSNTLWDNCILDRCILRETFFHEARLKKLHASETSFERADFFKTPLKGMDFSSCNIDGIMVSDTLQELRGMKINPIQAVDLVSLLGIKLV